MRHRAIACALVATVFACSIACKSTTKNESVSSPSPDLPSPKLTGKRLAQARTAVSDKGSGYQPRTRHKRTDGSAKYVNRLIFESSPYLLQHAHNPVNWFPWGDEAMRLARELNRPIFLSVGYSTCHWCHVMEDESFEDEAIAAFINEHYIAIKVDREERPDIDSIYMTAVQLLTRRGGWPMSVWLTPNLEPFFGGTYFPARDGDRGSRVGFLSLLRRHADEYSSDPAGVASRAQALVDEIARVMKPAEPGGIAASAVLKRAVSWANQRFDRQHGGSKGAPKFPSSFPIRLLLRRGASLDDPRSLQMAVTSLDKIMRGGIYDHVAGGFHRYSVDRYWLVPHFEKMLYDNALLTLAYLEAFQLTQREDFETTARETLDYIQREMTAPGGGFYSATDADSIGPSGHREEGYYFTWTLSELRQILTTEQVELVAKVYAVSAEGNFEGRTIFSIKHPLTEIARSLKLAPTELRSKLVPIKKLLLTARQQRPAPLRDDKIQTSWNGLMLSAFARAAHILNEPGYQAVAERNAHFLLTELRQQGRLHHSILGRKLGSAAFAQDYAFLAGGLIDLFELTSSVKYLDIAVDLMNDLEHRHADQVHGGYFLTAHDHEQLLVREKPDTDKAVPNGNSWAALNQLRLHLLTGEDIWRERAEMTLRAFAPQLEQSPGSLDEMLLALSFLEQRPKEIAIVVPKERLPNDSSDRALLDVLRSEYHPSQVRVVVKEGTTAKLLQRKIPWLNGKKARSGLATAYVCERGSCQLPTTDAKELRRQLKLRPAGN